MKHKKVIIVGLIVIIVVAAAGGFLRKNHNEDIVQLSDAQKNERAAIVDFWYEYVVSTFNEETYEMCIYSGNMFFSEEEDGKISNISSKALDWKENVERIYVNPEIEVVNPGNGWAYRHTDWAYPEN